MLDEQCCIEVASYRYYNRVRIVHCIITELESYTSECRCILSTELRRNSTGHESQTSSKVLNLSVVELTINLNSDH